MLAERRAVMIFANAQGRRVVEAIFPDVQWTTDEFFAKGHSPDWLFTHILVTKLPPELEARKPLTFVSPDAIGMAVAMALQNHSQPRRVFHYSGESPKIRVNIYDGPVLKRLDWARSLFAEYLAPGTIIGSSQNLN